MVLRLGESSRSETVEMSRVKEAKMLMREVLGRTSERVTEVDGFGFGEGFSESEGGMKGSGGRRLAEDSWQLDDFDDGFDGIDVVSDLISASGACWWFE